MADIKFDDPVAIAGSSDSYIKWENGAEKGSMLMGPAVDFNGMTPAEKISYWQENTGLKIAPVAFKPSLPKD